MSQGQAEAPAEARPASRRQLLHSAARRLPEDETLSVTELIPFAALVDLLPRAESAPGVGLPAFKTVLTEAPFVEPMMSVFESNDSPRITLISARGATGKSAMAQELSRRLNAPLWALGHDKAVSADALAARLGAYLGRPDPMSAEAVADVPLLIIDSMDEARLRVTGVSWDEYMASLANFVDLGAKLVILGRQRTMEDVWYSLAASTDEIGWYEISHFNGDQQREYVDLRAMGDAALPAYVDAREAVLTALNESAEPGLNEVFAGYAPVLDAAAKLLAPGANYLAVTNDFRSPHAGSNRLKVLRQILDTLLTREQSKVSPLARQLGLNPGDVFRPDEQVEWLASALLGAPAPSLANYPEDRRDEYQEHLRPFLDDHPFRDGHKWASPVFSSYVGSRCLDGAAAPQLVEVGAASGLLFEFVATDAAPAEVIEEAAFTALQASLLSAQVASSTTVTSLVQPVDSGSKDNSSVTARMALAHSDSSTVGFEAVVLIANPGHLELVSPLANIDVEYDGDVLVRAGGAALDLGPDVYIEGASIELSGASLQISRDAVASDVSGPTVDLRVHRSFGTNAQPTASVTPADFAITVDAGVVLTYPWIQFRNLPEPEEAVVSPDARARRFLNKFMNLARKHGHGGQRGVYIKKLHGRQALSHSDFQAAVGVLTSRGVAERQGDLLFVSKDWEKFRFDGKARPGMPSYDDFRAEWDPIVSAIAAALEG